MRGNYSQNEDNHERPSAWFAEVRSNGVGGLALSRC